MKKVQSKKVYSNNYLRESDLELHKFVNVEEGHNKSSEMTEKTPGINVADLKGMKLQQQ